MRRVKPQISSRLEKIGDIILGNTNQDFFLPTNGGQLPSDRFMYALQFRFRGRVTFAANGPSGVQADAPFSLIEYIKVSGYHRPRKMQEEFINVRGSELRRLTEIYTRSAPNLTPTSLTTGNTFNDIDFSFWLPFVPAALPVNQQGGYLLDAVNYNALKLDVRFADDFNIFTGQTAGAAAFSAFGGSTGAPVLTVMGLFAQDPNNQFQGFVPARTWRLFQEVTGGAMVNGGTNQRLFDIPTGYLIRKVLMKTGLKSTTVSSGNNAYNSLSNSVFQNIYVMRGTNKLIRWYPDQVDLQNELLMSFGLQSFPTGYAIIDFAQRGVVQEALDASGLVAGPSGDIDLFVQADIPNGLANQAALFLSEEIRGVPAVARVSGK